MKNCGQPMCKTRPPLPLKGDSSGRVLHMIGCPQFFVGKQKYKNFSAIILKSQAESRLLVF
jgi:hypothetical protein